MEPFDQRREGGVALRVAACVFLRFAVGPLVALAAAAVPGHLWRILVEPLARDALRLSLLTSLAATAASVVLGLPVAYLLARLRFRGREVLDTLIDLPVTLPPVVAGVALLLTFGRMGWLGRYLEAAGVRVAFSTLAVVLAQVFLAAPLFVRAARAGFESVPEALEEAAMTLGRSRWQTFWSVTVPVAAPALLAGVVLAWARALSEFGATLMFAGNLRGVTQTLPLAVMGAMEVDLELAIALSLLSLLLAFGALVGARLVVERYRQPSRSTRPASLGPVRGATDAD